MFEGKRTQYIVPGYTGHLPHKVYEDNVPLQEHKPIGKIPGYAGYVKGIKSENLIASTFGKITLDVSQDNFVKGQDLDAQHKYVSMHQMNNIPPSEMLQRTAADIVGVPNKTVTVKAPTHFNKTGEQIDQFTLSQSESFQQRLAEERSRPNNNSKVGQDYDGKTYVKIDKPIPGYTGFNRRVNANNIFGKTFAECNKESTYDTDKLHHEKQKNFNTQLHHEPTLKF